MRIILFLPILLAAPLSAGYGSENPKLEKLYQGFLAPCCWHEDLTVHDSPTAHELRAAIATMLGAGRSEEEIKSVVVSKYSKRILVLPEGGQRIWLFLTPLAALVGGLILVTLVVRRLRRQSISPA